MARREVHRALAAGCPRLRILRQRFDRALEDDAARDPRLLWRHRTAAPTQLLHRLQPARGGWVSRPARDDGHRCRRRRPPRSRSSARPAQRRTLRALRGLRPGGSMGQLHPFGPPALSHTPTRQDPSPEPQPDLRQSGSRRARQPVHRPGCGRRSAWRVARGTATPRHAGSRGSGHPPRAGGAGGPDLALRAPRGKCQCGGRGPLHGAVAGSLAGAASCLVRRPVALRQRTLDASSDPRGGAGARDARRPLLLRRGLDRAGGR